MKILKNIVIVIILLLQSFTLKIFSQNGVVSEVNNIRFPFNNTGNLAEYTDSIGGESLMGEYTFLYSAGFFLSGINDGEIWSNGVFASEEFDDYIPGKVSSVINNPKNRIYVVKSEDPDFGQSWVDWIDAVTQGAKYYDGNSDGNYNPVDLNGNGQWDETEDKPDILGDFTAWCVFNDGKESIERIFTDVDPLGIEVHQTLFAYSSTSNSGLNNAIFVRYIINNAGLVNEKFDSVYFGLVSDPDMWPSYGTDYTATDTTINAGLGYNIKEEEQNGIASTSLITMLLQGPHTYIPGETFIDVDGDGVFSNNIDNSQSTANYKRGPMNGIVSIPGSVNLTMTSASSFWRSPVGVYAPETKEELRNYLIGGMFPGGEQIDVKEFELGNGNDLGDQADLVNPKFMFSGNPVTKEGWLCVSDTDWRMLISTGTFALEVNKPVEILVAFIADRGETSLGSVESVQAMAVEIRAFYDDNFALKPTNIERAHKNSVYTFSLYQNYPNPFNPSTVINYSISSEGNVNLKVFDVLGREVETIVSGHKKSGSYEVHFDAAQLSSGVYFYTLQINDFISSKKMLLIK